MLRVALVAVLFLAPSVASAQAPGGIARIEAALGAALRSAYPEQPGRIVTRHENAGFATTVTASFDPPAYPGSGVFRVLVDASGRSYGQHGERDFAELVRALGWLRTAPSVDVFEQALSVAMAEGLLSRRRPPTLELVNGVLRCTLRRMEPMSGEEVETWTVEVRSTGPVSITRGPVVPIPTPPPRETIGRAGRGEVVDATDLLDALRSLEGNVDPELRGWLAAITALEWVGPVIASTAVGAIGSSRAAADALRARWQGLSPERREDLLNLAANMHGSQFRARIER